MNQMLQSPELLEVHTAHSTYTGGSQEWYSKGRRRMSGCGPTAASNLIWYMTRSRRELSCLCNTGNGDKQSFVRLMSEMFTYITPGLLGVNTSAIFTNGMLNYGEVHDIKLTPHVLKIPKPAIMRPSLDETCEFISSALQADCPVAFLNLSNGNQYMLDNWHWTTIIALDSATISVTISDQGRVLNIDFAAWLKTSLLGGALVYFTTGGNV